MIITEVKQIMKCQKCGANILPGAKFCTKCGNEVNGADETVLSDMKAFIKAIVAHPKKLLSFILITVSSVLLINKFFDMVMSDGTHVYRSEWDMLWHNLRVPIYYALRMVCVLLIIYTVGPKALTFILGGRALTREDDKERIVPLLSECIDIAKSDKMDIPDVINVYVIEKEYPHLIATGRNRICITRGMLEANPELIKAFLLEELYRISERDTEILVAGFMSSIWSFVFLSAFILFFRFAASMREKYNQGDHILYIVLGIVIGGSIVIPLYVALRLIYPKTDDMADEYICKKGYGECLCMYLDSVRQPGKPLIYYIESLIHRSENERIRNMQRLGIKY